MRTETKTTTVAETDSIMFGYWDENGEEFFELKSNITDEDKALVAEKFGCNPVLVDALIMLVDGIADAVGQDLKDIWKIVNRD